jgi:hypothetical protein
MLRRSKGITNAEQGDTAGQKKYNDRFINY